MCADHTFLHKINAINTMRFRFVDTQSVGVKMFRFSFSIEEYWIGLVEIEEDQPFWVGDCSNLTYTSMFTEVYDSNRMCYRLRRDHTPERKMCQSNEAFMCEYFSGKTIMNIRDSKISVFEFL